MLTAGLTKGQRGGQCCPRSALRSGAGAVTWQSHTCSPSRTTFGHVAHSTLGLLGTEHGEIVQERASEVISKYRNRAVPLQAVGHGRVNTS